MATFDIYYTPFKFFFIIIMVFFKSKPNYCHNHLWYTFSLHTISLLGAHSWGTRSSAFFLIHAPLSHPSDDQ